MYEFPHSRVREWTEFPFLEEGKLGEDEGHRGGSDDSCPDGHVGTGKSVDQFHSLLLFVDEREV